MMNLFSLAARRGRVSASRPVAPRAGSGYINKQVLLLWRERLLDRSYLEVERLGGHR